MGLGREEYEFESVLGRGRNVNTGELDREYIGRGKWGWGGEFIPPQFKLTSPPLPGFHTGFGGERGWNFCKATPNFTKPCPFSGTISLIQTDKFLWPKVFG